MSMSKKLKQNLLEILESGDYALNDPGNLNSAVRDIEAAFVADGWRYITDDQRLLDVIDHATKMVSAEPSKSTRKSAREDIY